MPLHYKFEVLDEKLKRREREEINEYYMASIVEALGGKPYLEVLNDLENLRKPEAEKEKEKQDAYNVAEATLKALEKSRGGE